MPFRLVAPTVVLAAAWLALCDQLFHIRTGTLTYHWTPQLFGQHIAVPVVFAIAAFGMLQTADRFNLGGKPGARSIALDVVIVTVAYLDSGVILARHDALFAIALLILYGLRVRARRDTTRAIVVGIAIAIGGTLTEAALSALGQFDYASPALLGVPWWLAPLYLHGSLLAIDLAATLRRREPAP